MNQAKRIVAIIICCVLVMINPITVMAAKPAVVPGYGYAVTEAAHLRTTEGGTSIGIVLAGECMEVSRVSSNHVWGSTWIYGMMSSGRLRYQIGYVIRDCLESYPG